MKLTIFFSIALFMIVSPAIGELSSTDLDKIRLVVKEEIAKVETELKAEIAKVETELKEEIAKSEKRLKEYVDTKFESVDAKFESVDTKFESVNKQLLLVVGFVSALIILIVATIGIPQIIMAWKGRNESEQDKRIEQLVQEVEALKQQRIVNP